MNERRTGPAETQPLLTMPFPDPTNKKKDPGQGIDISGWRIWALLGLVSLIAVAALMWFLLIAGKENWVTLKVVNVPPDSQKQGIPTADGKVILPYRKQPVDKNAMPAGYTIIKWQDDSSYDRMALVNALMPPSSAPIVPTDPPPGMVYVKGAEFQMGRNDSDDAFEKPAHPVSVLSFFIEKTEVTNEDYQKFLDADPKRLAPSNWGNRKFPAGKEKYPVTDVTWDDASEYAKSIGRRLPTEAEWEFAARGTDGRLYPWGGGWVPGNANVATNQLVPVGQYKDDVSPFGVLDMAGNAMEWTDTALQPYTGGQWSKAIFAGLSRFRNLKVIRGGHFDLSNDPSYSTVTRRSYNPARRQDWPAESDAKYPSVGFRCAKGAAQ